MTARLLSALLAALLTACGGGDDECTQAECDGGVVYTPAVPAQETSK